MSQTEEPLLTHHALLAAWGQHAHAFGVIDAIEAIELPQKTIDHRPQMKVLEFLAAILCRFEHLKDITASRLTPWTRIKPLPGPGDSQVGPITVGSAGH